MNIQIDAEHNARVNAAVSAGAAPDAQTYVQQLIDHDAQERFYATNRDQVSTLVRERLSGGFRPAAETVEELQQRVDDANRQIPQA